MLSIARTQYQKTKALYQKYERALIPAMLVFGFALDYVTFKNIQINTALIMLCAHFTLAGASIAFIHFYDAGLITQKLRFARLFAPLVVQFTFGALLGATFIFYWFSASIAVSWPFFFAVALLMISNEIFRLRFKRVIIHISVYYFITFSFLSIVLPYIFNSLDARLFLLAGIMSIIFMYAYVWALAKAQPKVRGHKPELERIALAIFIAMNALYFANIIPPIPLSLREAGAYHNVSRLGSKYVLTQEKESFLQNLLPGKTIHLGPNEILYAYTAIFAPTDLSARIYHQWQYYNESASEWENRDRLSFSITGGRKDGYRGYSLKSSVESGKWRVLVHTEQGKSLGRVGFNVERVDESPALKQIIR